jgi:nephrocystin-3
LSKKYELSNDEQWHAYLQRCYNGQETLQQLCAETPKLKLLPIADQESLHSIRPFLSSTFRDFSDERDLLFQQTFPVVEKLCEERGLLFSPLDLRWGVTTEQSASGQVVKICLDEIDRCRPFFVCSLGFRNGWAKGPDDPPEADWVQLLETTIQIGEEAYPWIKEKRDRSVTELEVLHGCLRNPNPRERVFVYFRDAEVLEWIEKKDRSVYAEMGYAEQKVFDLKRRLIEGGFNVRWFSDPAEMASLMEEDFTRVIKGDFPLRKQSSALEREVRDHAAFGDHLARLYVGGDKYYARLDEALAQAKQARHAAGVVPVVAESGLGSSTLVANWTRAVRTREAKTEEGSASQVLVITRFIGATADSANPANLLRWVMEEMKTKFASLALEEVPESEEGILRRFPDWLEHVAGLVTLVLCLDALDQLESGIAHDLRWLPQNLPLSCVVVVTSTPGTPSAAALGKRFPMVHTVGLSVLSDAECLDLLVRFLDMYGKEFDADQQHKVIDCPRTRNPMYLTTFMNEIRGFGIYEKLNDRIDTYLQATDVCDLFGIVIETMERDYGQAVPGLVRFVLCLLMCSRKGLDETELRMVLERALHMSAAEGTFPALEFSSVMLRLDQSLSNQGGRRTFSHKYLADAVEHKYISSPTTKSDAKAEAADGTHVYHRLLADFFQRVPGASPRVAEELPFHLHVLARHYQAVGDAAQLRATRKELIEVLTDLNLFPLLQGSAMKFDLHMYWRLLEELCAGDGAKQEQGHASSSTVAFEHYTTALEAYAQEQQLHQHVVPPPQDPALRKSFFQWQLAQRYFEVANFLASTSRYPRVEQLFQRAFALKVEVVGANHVEVADVLRREGDLYASTGSLDEARGMYQKAIDIHAHVLDHPRAVRDDPRVWSAWQQKFYVSNMHHTYPDEKQAPVYIKPTAPTEAVKYSRVQIAELRTLQAGLIKEQGDYDEALPLYQRSLEDMIELTAPDDPKLGVAVNNLADLYLRMARPRDALPLYQRALEVMERATGRKHPKVATILSSLATVHQQLEDFDAALDLYLEALTIKEHILGKDDISLHTLLNNLGKAYQARGALEEAMRCLQRCLGIQTTFFGGSNSVLVGTYLNIASVCKAMKKDAQALSYYADALKIARTNDDADREAGILARVVNLCVKQKKWGKVKEHGALELALRLRRVQEAKAEGKMELLLCYQYLSMAHAELEEREEAGRHFDERLRLSNEVYAGTPECEHKEAEVLMEVGVCFALGEEGHEQQRAVDALEKCVQIRTALLGPEHPMTDEAREWLSQLLEEE